MATAGPGYLAGMLRPGGSSMPGGGGGFYGGGSSNQYFSQMPSMPNPYSGAPTYSGGRSPGYMPLDPSRQVPGGGKQNLGSGIYTEPSQDPRESIDWQNYLKSQIGQGVPANPLLQQLMQFYGGGGAQGMPGAGTMQTIADQGISALPEWQAMLGAMQRNIGENQANLREQFAGMGDLAGSPFGTAMSDYSTQTALGQNALLGQLQQQNILQGQMPAAEFLMGGAGQMGQFGQSLLPQYNPMNQFAQQMATTYAPMFQTQKGGGMMGGLMSGLGSLASMFCWVAASFYGWLSPETLKIRRWMLTRSPEWLLKFYLQHGEEIAKTSNRWQFKPLFDVILAQEF